MSWFLVILLLSFSFGCFSDEAGHGKKLPSAVVVGTVYCDTCFQQDFSMGSHFISGASVSVECKDGSSNTSFKKEVKTNDHGKFRVQLPFSVSKHEKRIKGCTVKLISSSEPYCAVASSATSSSLLLKSRKQGLHIFSAGFFSFKPLKLPNLCNQKPSIHHNTNKGLLGSGKKLSSFFPSPIQDPNTTIPKNIGKVLHQKLARPEKFFFPPNPFQPTPTVPNPNPVQPTPIVPYPFQPTPTVPNPNPVQPTPIVQYPFQPTPTVPNPAQSPPIVPYPFQPSPTVPNPVQPTPIVPYPFQQSPTVPNPVQPTPIVPYPFQPSPTVPNPYQPSPTVPNLSPSGPSPLFPFPSVPGLNPSSPPPSSPKPNFPFPFQPWSPPSASSTNNASP